MLPNEDMDGCSEGALRSESSGVAGRSTPAFGVVPTPLAVVPPREVKPRAQKKRKAVFDLFDLRTVIHAE